MKRKTITLFLLIVLIGLANAHEFTIENITLQEHYRDGVHVNGPSSDGVIRGVRGDSHDDRGRVPAILRRRRGITAREDGGPGSAVLA